MSIKCLEGKVVMEKNFTDDELFTARCLEFEISADHRKVTAYVDKTLKKALKGFMEYSFKTFMLSSDYDNARKFLFKQIKDEYKKDWDKFNEDFKPADLYTKLPSPRPLYKHQTEGIYSSKNRKHLMFFFEQGLGKTAMSASISRLFNHRRTLIVAPNVVKWSFFNDLTKDFGYNPLYFTILDSSRCMYAYVYERFILVNYESLAKFSEYIFKDEVSHIIVDELHKAKNHKTAIFKSLKKVIDHYPEARVSMMTGTPISNRVMDLFAYLKLIDHPLGENFYKFKEKYARGTTKVTGIKNEEDLILKMSNISIRKTSTECLDLPELRIGKCYFQMDDPTFQNEYSEQLEQMYTATQELYDVEKRIAMLSADNERTSDDTVELNQLKQKRNQLKFVSNGNINTMNKICAMSKVPKIIELIDSLIEIGEKVLLFATYKDVIKKIYAHYGDQAVYIDGSVSPLNRNKAIEKFKSNPKVMVYIGQVTAAGIGVNLTNARNVIFANLPFTTDVVSQAYKRAHRSGQKLDVNVTFALIEDSIDEKIYKLLNQKQQDINAVIDHDKTDNLDLGSLQGKLFNDILREYEKKKGIKESIVKQRQLV